jgi:phosphatidylserine/phosphatidylglycerophosphate/cardiolipin synthase-like enzyme
VVEQGDQGETWKLGRCWRAADHGRRRHQDSQAEHLRLHGKVLLVGGVAAIIGSINLAAG